MEFKPPPIAKLTADNGREWLSAIRPFLLSAGYWNCIAIPEEEVPPRDKWLGLNDGYSYRSFADLSFSDPPGVDAGPGPSNQLAPQPTVAAAARAPLPDDREKMRLEMKALGLMLMVVDESMREWAEKSLTPSELYNAVRKQVIYAERFKARQYAQELNCIKQYPTETVHAYFSRGKKLANQLAFTGQGMSEQGVVENLLFGLLPAYSEERLAWSHPSKAASLSYWSVLEAVEFREHHTLTLNTKKPTASALSATGEKEKGKGRGRGKGKGAQAQQTCKFCKGSHDILACLQLRHALALAPASTPRQPFAPPQHQQQPRNPQQHQQPRNPQHQQPRNPQRAHLTSHSNHHRNSQASAFVAAVGPLLEEERDAIVSEFMAQYEY